MTVAAKVICDSISPEGVRLTTLEVQIHRFVLSEFNTHRAFSRNSASSRAIPIQRQIDRVYDDPAIPLEFGSNQPGMQAGEPLKGEDLAVARDEWLWARDQAVRSVLMLKQLNVHKQVANRLLEPFMWHTVIVSATDWAGFFSQRCSPLAQPEIRRAAECMRHALYMSNPTLLGHGEWHTPFIDGEDRAAALRFVEGDNHYAEEVLRRVSVARCARVSYLTHDGQRSVKEDLALYERLASAEPPHHSPFEHVATPALRWEEPLGNFQGWHQLRHMTATVAA